VSKENKYFQSLLKREGKDSFIFTLATFIPLIASFLLMPLMWQKLTPQDYGVIAVIEMIGVFVVIFLGLNLDQSITRFYYEWDEEIRKKKIGALWVLSWVEIIVVGSCLLLFIPDISHYIFLDIDKDLIFLGLVAVVLQQLFLTPFALIRIKKLPVFYSTLNLFRAFMQIGMSIYFVLILDEGIRGYLVANVYSALIVALCLIPVMFKYSKANISFLSLKDELRFSLPLIPATIVSAFTGVIDRYFLQHFASIDSLGIYSQAMKFAGIVSSLHSALKMSYVPFLVKNIDDKTVINLVVNYYFATLLLVGFVISIFVDEFVILINNPLYFDVIRYVPFLILAQLVNSVGVYYTPGIFLSKRTELNIVLQSINLIVILIPGYFLISLMHGDGIIILNLLSSVVGLIALFLISRKVYALNIKYSVLASIFGSYIVLMMVAFIEIENIWYSLFFGIGLLILFVVILLYRLDVKFGYINRLRS
jgi:O-antigen/teichoic acid export membrane protein